MDYQGMTGKIYQVEEERMNGGGEGTIHGIVGMNGYVAKIFKPDKRSADREEKLRCMVKKGATVKNLEHITWPLDVIYNAEGFAGYVMQKIENVQSLTAVYNGDKYNPAGRLQSLRGCGNGTQYGTGVRGSESAEYLHQFECKR